MSTVNEHLGSSIHVDQVNTVVEVPRAERMKCIKASTYIYIYYPRLGGGTLGYIQRSLPGDCMHDTGVEGVVLEWNVNIGIFSMEGKSS
jgi:hypothetical protein